MDPNEQEADERLMEAEETEDSAQLLREAGNEETALKLEEKAQELKEGGEEQKMDSESLINQGMAEQRTGSQPQ